MEKFQSLADILGVQELDAKGVPVDPDVPAKPFLKMTVKDFARGVLESQEYRESVYRRIIMDTLPPAVEGELYNRAYGKNVDKLEVKDTSALEDLTLEHLEARAAKLVALMQKLRQEEGSSDSIH